MILESLLTIYQHDNLVTHSPTDVSQDQYVQHHRAGIVYNDLKFALRLIFNK